MKKVLFKNEYFISERFRDGSTVITVLKDINNFYGIDLEGCQFNTNSQGFIDDKFTKNADMLIKDFCDKMDIDTFRFKNELRNRTLNTLMGML